MSFEIERKFLVYGDVWRSCPNGQRIVQGYFFSGAGTKIRVRVQHATGYLTIKGKREGFVRTEFERVIPMDLARSMLSRLSRDLLIVKTRYAIEHAGMTWIIDVFEGHNAGLVLAEIELFHPDQAVALPGWVGAEVTFDPRYGNSHLSAQPISTWPQAA